MIVSSASWLHGRGLWLGFAAFASVMPGVRFAAVSGADAPKPNAAVLQATEQQALRGVLTRDQQALLTPQAVLDELLVGNQRFIKDDLTQRNHSLRIREAYAGQFPKAVILSCLDSRIPVEDVFDRGIGDIFVARVAGNFVNEDILGSMEFACHVAGARLMPPGDHLRAGRLPEPARPAAAVVPVMTRAAKDAGARNADLFAPVAPADLRDLLLRQLGHADGLNAVAAATLVTAAVPRRAAAIGDRGHGQRARCDPGDSRGQPHDRAGPANECLHHSLLAGRSPGPAFQNSTWNLVP